MTVARRTAALLVVLTTLVALGGCGTYRRTDATVRGMRNATARLRAKESRELARAPVSFRSGFYLGTGRPLARSRRARLPAVFREPVVLVARGLYLYQIADRIARISGLPVRLGALLRAREASNSTVETERQILHSTGRVMSFRYRGTLAGLLDAVCAHYGLSWRWRRGAIRIFQFETRSWALDVLPGAIDTQITLTDQSELGTEGGGTAGGANGQSAQTIAESQQNDFWQAIAQNVKALLTPHGILDVDPESGLVTVTDRPEILRRVGRYLRRVNRAMGREVAVVVKVYSLELSSSELAGFNLAAAYEDLDKNFEIASTPEASPVSTAGVSSLSATILGTPGTHIGSFSGSTALAQALRTYGRVTLLTQGSGIALQGQPLPIQVTQTVGYLASAQVESTSLVGTATALTPGEVTTGFSLVVVPRILSGGWLTMQYAIDLSTLTSLQTITSGDASIQVPSVASQRFVQRVRMRSGETLVLAGYEQVGANRQGAQGLFGLFSSAQRSRQVIFVTITARRV